MEKNQKYSKLEHLKIVIRNANHKNSVIVAFLWTIGKKLRNNQNETFECSNVF